MVLADCTIGVFQVNSFKQNEPSKRGAKFILQVFRKQMEYYSILAKL